MKSKKNKFKIMTVLGTRPEIIRLSAVINKLEHYCNQILVHTGQNYDYELNEIFFDDLGVRQPDHFLNASGENASETIGNIIISIDQVLEKELPDAILVLGDTNSSLSVIPAKKRKIPIFHMEAGNRCFDQRVPEETNRKIVDHTADINLTYSTIARDYLIKEGIPPERVIKTGSPMKEVLSTQKEKIGASDVLTSLSLKNENYFVVSCHREENVDDKKNISKLANLVNEICKHYKLPVIFSTHPRTKKRLEEYNIKFESNVRLLKPLGFSDYIKLQKCAKAVISDSGTITEESSILNFPAINIREAHERPEGFEEASVMMTGLNSIRVMQALKILEDQTRGESRTLKPVYDYENNNVSDKVLRIVISYTDFINRTVWGKNEN